MGSSSSKKPTGPIYLPDQRRPGFLFVLSSPEVILSVVAMAASYCLLMTVTGTFDLHGSRGLWQTFARKSRAKLQSREAALLPDPPTAISADMTLAVACILAANCFLSACARVLFKEQQRVEAAEEAAFLEAVTNPQTRQAALAKKADALAARIKFWEENDKRRAANQEPRRERIKRLDVMADEVLLNIIVSASILLSAATAYFVTMHTPNQIRGFGASGMLIVLVGGLVVCATDRYLSGLRHYCGYVNLVCVTALLVLVARAAVFAR